MSVLLSKRLQAVADGVKHGSRVVDVGTDHAYIPIFLLEHGIVERAIASDIALGPVEVARRNVEEAGLAPHISVRHGGGLSTVKPGEVDTILLAGMGGHIQTMVLTEASDVVDGVSRIVVQPQNSSGKIRALLYRLGFHIVREQVIHEDSRYYQVVVTDKYWGKDLAYNRYENEFELMMALKYGPYLLTSEDKHVQAYIQSELLKLQGVRRKVSLSETDKSLLKLETIDAELAFLQTWLRERETAK